MKQRLADEQQKKAKIKYDTKNLDDIIAMLKKDYRLRVGVIGSKAKQKNGSKTNAEIGTFHEQPNGPGKGIIPRRSFLIDSILHELNFNSEKMKPIKKFLFTQFFDKKAPEKFLQDLGAKCLLAIETGFATNGFGRWKAWSASYEAKRKRMVKRMPSLFKGTGIRLKVARELIGLYSNILTLTGKLRHSISFKIFKNLKK